MRNRFCIPLLMTGLLLSACNQDQKPAATVPVLEKKATIMEPFRFHKMIEAAPGNDFDIVSWGRGSATTGAFLILHSDSATANYVTTTGDLKGSIVDVYNSDMDLDGNPEILIQTKTADTTNYTAIYAFEFNNDKANKLDFPKLTKSQRQGYRGNDNFYIQDGKFMREFPIYDGTGKDAKPTGQKRLLQYGLHSNEFTVQQVSKDSTSATTATSGKMQPVAKKHQSESNSSDNVSTTTTTKKTKDKTTSTKKKHKEEEHTSTHKKKKKHHHHSEE